LKISAASDGAVEVVAVPPTVDPHPVATAASTTAGRAVRRATAVRMVLLAASKTVGVTI